MLTCPRCKGIGQIIVDSDGPNVDIYGECPRCKGSKEVKEAEPDYWKNSQPVGTARVAWWKHEALRHRLKWEDYERDYILPSFAWAKEVGFDLKEAVTANPGRNCVELLVRHLIDTRNLSMLFGGADFEVVRSALKQVQGIILSLKEDVTQMSLLHQLAKEMPLVLRLVSDALEATERLGKKEGVPSVEMLLTCPLCHLRHIDEGEFAEKLHHTHACQSCGHVWRPAIQNTVGVRFLKGFKNPSKEV